MADPFRHATIGLTLDDSPLNEPAMLHTVLGHGAGDAPPPVEFVK